MKRLIVLTAILISMVPPASAQVKSKEPGEKPTRREVNSSEDQHPFFTYLNFTGEAYADRSNPKCEPGFIGWYRESTDEDPVLIIPNDAFRNIQTDCRPEDLKVDNTSCLKKNFIQRRLDIRGEVYSLKLTMLEKAGQIAFRIQRFKGKKLQKSCLYTPLSNP